MKKLLILLLITVALLFSQAPKTHAYTVGTTPPNGTFAILIEINTDEDYCVLYDWQDDKFYVQAIELVDYVGNLNKVMLYDELGPIWEFSAEEGETVAPHLQTSIIPYYVDIATIEGANAGYLSGYEDGEADGILIGYVDGLSDGYAAGEEDGYADGLTDGYVDGEEDGYAAGLIDGYADGLADGSGIVDGDAMFEFGYNVGLSDGYDDGFNDRFHSGIENWLVPAIIVVIFLGGAVTIISRKRKEE